MSEGILVAVGGRGRTALLAIVSQTEPTHDEAKWRIAQTLDGDQLVLC